MKLLSEFKKFISRGNVIDMAIGVIIGSAFTGIVNSLVNDIIMPFISLITGGLDFSTLSIPIGDAKLSYGAFVGAVINFLLISSVIFTIVKVMNQLRTQLEKLEPLKDENSPAKKECPYCITQIDFKATRCPNCTSDLKPSTKELSEISTSEIPLSK